jgi:GNAT superfamily N-acetyltransferase
MLVMQIIASVQNSGIGRLLIQKAIDFCRDSGCRRVYLWTFAGLTAARHLYEQFGFVLDEEYVDSRWGNSVTCHKFQLNL